MAPMDAERRKRLGAWYTPPALVDAVVSAAFDDLDAGRFDRRVVRILDPACGDGRFLAAAALATRRAGFVPQLHGVDVDQGAVVAARRALAGEDARVRQADSLHAAWDGERFDVVIGNPPFLSPLSATNGSTSRSAPRGAPYADAAAQFLALSARLAEEDGGRIALVLPQSILGNRDAAPARRAVADVAAVRWLWWSPESVFDASVRTCALVAVRGASHGAVRRVLGQQFVAVPDAPHPGSSWSGLIADLQGVPRLDGLAVDGTIGDRAIATAGFRDEYYGLVGAVGDDVDGPPLITSGLIDVGVCRWGQRPVRFAKQRFEAPRVDLDALAPSVRRWFDAQLVPKVLVASQTRVIESVADPDGAWLPAVPVVSVRPRPGVDVWSVAAVLTSPVTSALLAGSAAGSGLSAHALRVSAKAIAALPWPAGPTAAAVEALRAGDPEDCATKMVRAYGLGCSDARRAVFAWWTATRPSIG